MNEQEQAELAALAQGNAQATDANPAPVIPTPAKTGKRSNWVIAHTVKDGVITWSVKDAGTLALHLDMVHTSNMLRAAIHGFVQRISDAAAIARDSETGKSATPAEKFQAMKRLVDHYASGAAEWSLVREGGGTRATSGTGLLRAALLLWQPEKGVEAISKWVEGLKPAQVAALLMSKELKPHVDAAREAQLSEAAGGIDADELLSGL